MELVMKWYKTPVVVHQSIICYLSNLGQGRKLSLVPNCNMMVMDNIYKALSTIPGS